MKEGTIEYALLLERVEGLLRKGWCKEHMALDKRGRRVAPTSGAAASFCLIGAVHQICSDNHYSDYSFVYGRMRRYLRQSLSERLPEVRSHVSLSAFNDDEDTTQGEVLSVVRRAVELARAENIPLVPKT